MTQYSLHLHFLKQKAALSYLISYKHVMQLKPKKTVENREKLRFRFSGKNRDFGFGSVPVTALVLCAEVVTKRHIASGWVGGGRGWLE